MRGGGNEPESALLRLRIYLAGCGGQCPRCGSRRVRYLREGGKSRGILAAAVIAAALLSVLIFTGVGTELARTLAGEIADRTSQWRRWRWSASMRSSTP